MRTQTPDTSPEAERVLIELLRQTPPWRQFQLAEEATRQQRAAIMAELRERFPHDSDALLRRRVADVWLGPDLANKAYGPLAEVPTDQNYKPSPQD